MGRYPGDGPHAGTGGLNMEPAGTWFSGPTSLSFWDYGFLVVALTLMLLLAWRKGRQEATTKDFFLGGRAIPWWVAGLAFVATEISAMTVIGVPAQSCRENWNYIQFFLGSALARLVIAFLFIPAFQQCQCSTIYEYLDLRFGWRTRFTASLFFFLARLLASGVRLMVACLAVSVILGWSIIPVIVLFCGIGMLYIGYGGVKAVAWTGALQVLTFLCAGLATVAFLLWQIDGGWVTVWQVAGAAGRLEIWNMGSAFSDPEFLRKIFFGSNILWVALLSGFFGSLAVFGTDHEMMQKLLIVRTRWESQKAVLLSIAVSFVLLFLFLAAGSCLYSYYAVNPGLVLPESLDRIYPHFMVTAMPGLLRGLVLTAIVMASIDLPLSSLSAVFVIDVYRPLFKLFKREADGQRDLTVARAAIVVFALLLGIIACFLSYHDGILWLAFKIGGVTSGPLLGVFLFGLLTARRADRASAAVMLLLGAVNAALLYFSETGAFPLGWNWLGILGTGAAFACCWLLGPRLDPVL